MDDTTNELPPMVGALDLGGWDVEQAFNARNWLEEALKSAGAKITGAGMGLGGVDVSFILDGVQFQLDMHPIIRKPQ